MATAPWLSGLFVLAGLVALACGEQPPPGGGVVVEEVEADSAAEAAGLLPGDRLFAWSREPRAGGDLVSPFDLHDLLTEQAPRGPIAVRFARGKEVQTVVLDRDDWGITFRPNLHETDLEQWHRAHAAGEGGGGASSGARLGDLATAASARGEWRLAAWHFLDAGRQFSEAKAWDDAEAAYSEGLVAAERAGDPLAAALLAESAGLAHLRQGRLAEASRGLADGLARREAVEPRALRVTSSLNNLATVEVNRGDLAAAEMLHRRALALREELAPESLKVAQSLNGLGRVHAVRGDLDAAEAAFRRALAIRRRRAPGSLDLAHSYNSLGALLGLRGDLAGAQRQLERAAAAWARLAPTGDHRAATLNNLGVVARRRGDLAAAESYYRRSLEIEEARSPRSVRVAVALYNLGDLARQRGDLAAAERDHRRALAIRERLAPESLDVAFSLNDLGRVLAERGDLRAAEPLLQRALAIRWRLAPESLDFAASLAALARLDLDRGAPAAAADGYRRALALVERHAPGSVRAAEARRLLAEVDLARGDLEAARAGFERARAMLETLAPGSLGLAEAHHGLGRVGRARGEAAAARAHFERAVAALEEQEARLGGDLEAAASFRARHRRIYEDLIDLLLELGANDSAFHVLERWRSRRLADLLAARDLVFARDLAPALDRERRMLRAERAQAWAELTALEPGADAGRIAEQVGRLRDVDRRREELRERIRRDAPRLAALTEPPAFDVAGARARLGSGGVLLSYLVESERTLLFALDERELRVAVVPISIAALSDEVERFGLLLAAPGPGREPREAVVERGAALYDRLLAPAADLIGRAEHLVIVPDGPLHRLAFAALVRDDDADPRGWSYLVEWKPLRFTASASIAGAPRSTGASVPGRETGLEVVVFADPATGGRLPARRHGRAPSPLPWSRREAEAIAGQFAEARTYLGASATEGRAKALNPAPRFVHFAVHGYLDDRLPLDSGLLLTAGAADGRVSEDGLLQAWEILEDLRLDVELVVLSACETGLGEEVAGQGLLGLTRAFQHAGARAVVASQWRVSDRSTAVLMSRFYGYLRRGLAPDEALQAAQRELASGPVSLPPPRPGLRRRLIGPLVRATRMQPDEEPIDASHPHHWAAFQLIGDRH